MKPLKAAKVIWQNLEKRADEAKHPAARTYSNFNEQQIIDRYVRDLGITNRTIVDIGAGDGIRNSNSYALVRGGWGGVGIEYDSRTFGRLSRAYRFFPDIYACRSRVSPDNIVQLLQGFEIDPEFGVLSLDIDGNDYWVLDAVLSAFRPRLVVSEYNEKIPPPIRFVVDYNKEFHLRHHFFGYSVAKLQDLLDKHRYALLEVEYNNVFIAPAEIAGSHATDIAEAYDRGYADRPDRKEKFKSNENMELLQTLPPDEGIKFLDRFYAEWRGTYQLGIG